MSTRPTPVADDRGIAMLEILTDAGNGPVPASDMRREMKRRGYTAQWQIAETVAHLRDEGFNVTCTKGKDAAYYLDPPAARTADWTDRLLRESFTSTTRAHRSLTRVLNAAPSDDRAILLNAKTMLVGAAYALGGMTRRTNDQIAAALEMPVANGT